MEKFSSVSFPFGTVCPLCLSYEKELKSRESRDEIIVMMYDRILSVWAQQEGGGGKLLGTLWERQTGETTRLKRYVHHPQPQDAARGQSKHTTYLLQDSQTNISILQMCLCIKGWSMFSKMFFLYLLKFSFATVNNSNALKMIRYLCSVKIPSNHFIRPISNFTLQFLDSPKTVSQLSQW